MQAALGLALLELPQRRHEPAHAQLEAGAEPKLVGRLLVTRYRGAAAFGFVETATRLGQQPFPRPP